MKKRLLATLLAVCLLVGMLPMAASASAPASATDNIEDSSVEGNNTLSDETVLNASNLADTRTENKIQPKELCDNYTINVTQNAIVDSLSCTEVTVSGTNLRKHQNAQNGMGYWAGVSWTAPENQSINKVKVGVAANKTDLDTQFNSATLTNLDKNVNPAQTNDGLAMHLDVSTLGSLSTSGVWLKLQWYNGESPVGSEMVFNVKYDVDIYDVYGTAAWDPGKTGGSGCTGMNNPTITDHNYTFTAAGTIEWYPPSTSNPERGSGNMVGIVINAPESLTAEQAAASAKYSIDDGNSYSWANEGGNGKNLIYWYPTFTAVGESHHIDITWKSATPSALLSLWTPAAPP